VLNLPLLLRYCQNNPSTPAAATAARLQQSPQKIPESRFFAVIRQMFVVVATGRIKAVNKIM
jgi:hypothetical protein